MQSIWSRVAQTKCLCTCPACASTISALAARRTTAAIARNRLRTGDVFTVFASSVAATATLVNSSQKDARRKEWDKVIGEARAKVQETEVEQEYRLARLSHATGDKTQDNNRGDQLETAHTNGSGVSPNLGKATEEWDRGGDSWAKVFQWAAQNHELRELSGFRDWRGPSLTLLQQLSPDQIQQLISDRSVLRAFYGGSDCENLVDETAEYSLSAKKLRSLEWSTAKLVTKLLLHSELSHKQDNLFQGIEQNPPMKDDFDDLSCNDQSQGSEELPAPLDTRAVHAGHIASELSMDNVNQGQLLSKERKLHERLNNIEARLQSLRVGPEDARSQAYEEFESPAAPRYQKNPPNDSKDLNFSLSYLLRKLDRKDQSPTISKICQNLLAAQTPPNIHTFNMLLVRFCYLEDRDLIHAVVASMRECHMRPNELTHAILLRHYTATNNALGFTKHCLLMDGYGVGLSLAAPDQKIPSFASHRYRVLKSRRLKTAVKARMNSEVYESLIIGALRFYGAESAMKYFRDMINEGWQASTATLASILESCCERLWWEDGLCIWRQIIVSTTSESILAHAYECILLLCRMCDQDVIFNEIMQDGLVQGIPLTSRAASLVESKQSDNHGALHVPHRAKLEYQNSIEETSTSQLEARMKRFYRRSKPMNRSRDTGPTNFDARREIPASPPDKVFSLQDIMHSLEHTVQGVEPRINDSLLHVVESNVSEISEMTRRLSTQIRELNGDLPSKMTDDEYHRFRSKRANRKDPEVIANTNYEEYKRETVSKSEQQHREGQVLDQKPLSNVSDEEFQQLQTKLVQCGHSKTLSRAIYEGFKRKNNGQTINEYISNLLDPRPVPSTPSLTASWSNVARPMMRNEPYPGAWGDADVSPVQKEVQAN